MTKTINLSRYGLAGMGMLLALFLVLSASTQTAQAAISSQLELGSRGGDVTELQQFLATESSIYPAGLITGYFGPMTRAAVVQFQAAYDISQVGRVGPATMGVINDVMASNSGLDISAPVMSSNSVAVGRNDATISWTTNEAAKGQVFYDTSPIQVQEATRHAQQPYISGQSVSSNNGYSRSEAISLQNLQPNTLYYYLNVATDDSGNVSVRFPNTFRTNN